MTLSDDLTTFQILGQNLSIFFVGILVQTMTPKRHFEIYWPLTWYKLFQPGMASNSIWWRTIRGFFFVCCWKQFNRFTRDVMSPKIYRAGGTRGDRGTNVPSPLPILDGFWQNLSFKRPGKYCLFPPVFQIFLLSWRSTLWEFRQLVPPVLYDIYETLTIFYNLHTKLGRILLEIAY